MAQTVETIARALAARAEGDVSLPIEGASEPQSAGPKQIALAMSEKYIPGLAQGKALAAILPEGTDWQALGLKAAIFVARPRLAMAGLSKAFDPGPEIAPGIHPTAVIDPTAERPPQTAIERVLGPLPIVAEDLGFITQDVHEAVAESGIANGTIATSGFACASMTSLPLVRVRACTLRCTRSACAIN